LDLAEFVADVEAMGEKGVLCEFWTTPLYHVSIRFLSEVGLAKPILTKIPACSEHGCRFLEECPKRRLFEERTGARGGLKARLTATGVAAFSSSETLAHALKAHPMVRALLAALAEKPQSLFDLHSRLLFACLAEIDEKGVASETAFQRNDLRGCLELLELLGEAVWDRPTGMVSLA
jgi:hypothetical protein